MEAKEYRIYLIIEERTYDEKTGKETCKDLDGYGCSKPYKTEKEAREDLKYYEKEMCI